MLRRGQRRQIIILPLLPSQNPWNTFHYLDSDKRAKTCWRWPRCWLTTPCRACDGRAQHGYQQVPRQPSAVLKGPSSSRRQRGAGPAGRSEFPQPSPGRHCPDGGARHLPLKAAAGGIDGSFTLSIQPVNPMVPVPKKCWSLEYSPWADPLRGRKAHRALAAAASRPFPWLPRFAAATGKTSGPARSAG